MRYSNIIAVALFGILLICCGRVAGEEEDFKTDLKIITGLDGSGFFAPALVKNNSLVYNNFEFNIYSNTNNTTYEIKLENSTIRIDIIENFKDVFIYNMTLDYINLLEVYIGNHTYSYRDINVIAYSIMDRNRTWGDEEEKVEFTQEEYDRIISRLEFMAFLSNFSAALLAGGVAYHYITEYKKYTPVVIA